MKIRAYRVSNGQKVWIPEHWLGHPVLGAPFRETPSSRAAKAGKQEGTAGKKSAVETKEK